MFKKCNITCLGSTDPFGLSWRKKSGLSRVKPLTPWPILSYELDWKTKLLEEILLDWVCTSTNNHRLLEKISKNFFNNLQRACALTIESKKNKTVSLLPYIPEWFEKLDPRPGFTLVAVDAENSADSVNLISCDVMIPTSLCWTRANFSASGGIGGKGRRFVRTASLCDIPFLLVEFCICSNDLPSKESILAVILKRLVMKYYFMAKPWLLCFYNIYVLASNSAQYYLRQDWACWINWIWLTKTFYKLGFFDFWSHLI